MGATVGVVAPALQSLIVVREGTYVRSEQPTHKASLYVRVLSRRGLVRSAIVGVAASIITVVLTLGGATTPPVAETPDVPLASGPSDVYVTEIPAERQTPTEKVDSNESTSSSTGTKVTPASSTSNVPPPTVKPQPSVEAPDPLRVWSALGSYEEGELVTHQGDTYRALQDYVGEGDPDWIYADSLWVRV